jgi:hypothetical protein
MSPIPENKRLSRPQTIAANPGKMDVKWIDVLRMGFPHKERTSKGQG